MSGKLTEAVKARWLKWIVGYCIGFTSLIIVACYVASWWGVDNAEILGTTRLIFGGELLLTAAIKLIGGRKATDGKDAGSGAKSGGND